MIHLWIMHGLVIRMRIVHDPDMDQSFTIPESLREVREALNARKGEWHEIATSAGVPYSTLAKVAQGFTPDPRISTVESLRRAVGLPS